MKSLVGGLAQIKSSHSAGPGTLYLVATPLGNLGDITLRALEVLKHASLVACEDTRRSATLLDHYGIATPRRPLHEHNETKVTPALVERLLAGDSIALVSDAGMPLVSDPGAGLVAAALARGVRVEPIPGASAPLAALTASGLPAVPFAFLGFLPARRGERRRYLQEVAAWEPTLVAFESPRRLSESLRDLLELLGPRPAAVAREMTKLHEEIRRDSLDVLAAQFAGRPVKGEITLVVGGAKTAASAAAAESPATPSALLERYLGDGLTRQEAMRRAAQAAGLSRKEFYRRVLAEKAQTES